MSRWISGCLCLLICGLAGGQTVAAPVKLQADLTIVHGTVVTMDPQRRVLQDGAVAIAGDTLVAVAVHAPVGMHSGLPLPLGILSFDQRVIDRTSEHLAKIVDRVVPADVADPLLRGLTHEEGLVE